MGSSSSWLLSGALCTLFFLSGVATSKTSFPTFNWKLALGSAGSGLPLCRSPPSTIARDSLPCPYIGDCLVGFPAALGVFLVEAGDHVFRLAGGGIIAGCCCCSLTRLSLSDLLFLLNGLWLWKNPLFFFWTCFSSSLVEATMAPLPYLTRDCLPLGTSWLDMEVGFEYSLCESRLEGRAGLAAELRSDGGPVRQYMVIPSGGYSLCGTG